jgi:hypothetical protein
MTGDIGSNCDGYNYTQAKGNALIDGFRYLVHNQSKDVFIGKWHHAQVTDYLQTLVGNVVIPFVDYHLIMTYKDNFKTNSIYAFVKAIRESSLKKIIISNKLNTKLKSFFKADHYICIPERNWFDKLYDPLLAEINRLINNEPAIILMSGGMGSIAVASDLLQRNTQGISFIDTGSSFDHIAQHRHTRDQTYSYEVEYNYFKDFMD